MKINGLHFIKYLWFFSFLGVIISTQYLYDQEKSKRLKPSPLVLGTDIVKASDLGLHSATSDLMWLASIQYFGDWQTDGYQKIDDYIRLVNDLDQKFAYPYAFGVLILPSVGLIDEALEIGEKGLKNIHNDWRIPYYMATTYHIYKNDQENALKYFDVAANTPGVPDGIKTVSTKYGSSQDMRTKSKAVWQGILENSNDEVVRKRAYNYLLHYQILDLLEGASKRYKEKTGKFPEKLEQLVSENILNEIPIDPLGLELNFTETGKIRVE